MEFNIPSSVFREMKALPYMLLPSWDTVSLPANKSTKIFNSLNLTDVKSRVFENWIRGILCVQAWKFFLHKVKYFHFEKKGGQPLRGIYHLDLSQTVDHVSETFSVRKDNPLFWILTRT